MITELWLIFDHNSVIISGRDVSGGDVSSP